MGNTEGGKCYAAHKVGSFQFWKFYSWHVWKISKKNCLAKILHISQACGITTTPQNPKGSQWTQLSVLLQDGLRLFSRAQSERAAPLRHVFVAEARAAQPDNANEVSTQTDTIYITSMHIPLAQTSHVAKPQMSGSVMYDLISSTGLHILIINSIVLRVRNIYAVEVIRGCDIIQVGLCRVREKNKLELTLRNS